MNSAVLALILFGVVYNIQACLDFDWDFLSSGFLSDLCPISSNLFKCHTIEENGPISDDLVTECLKRGRELSSASEQRATQIVKSGINLNCYCTSIHHFFSGKLPDDVRKAGKTSQEMLKATQLMQTKFRTKCTNVTPNTFMSFLEHQVIKVNDAYCKPKTFKCSSSSKFRSYDGSCNNLEHPDWGRKNAPFTRIAKPRYADGIHAMPTAVSGRPLPNARELSTRFFSDQPSLLSKVLNYLNMQWGQFITHDMLFQMMDTTDEGGIQCCIGEGKGILPPDLLNEKCIPIMIPENDVFYTHYGIKCMNFVRSVTTPRDDCTLGYAEQMNTVTSFIDGSTIYGNDKKATDKLRSKKGGKLRTERRLSCKRGFLPSVKDKCSVCDITDSSDPCYEGGDARLNQTPTLALLHTLLLREHNRVAEILGTLNPLWSDEKLFQEARKIVVAEIQHITYQEWLPLNFGKNYIKYYRISPIGLYSKDYDEEVNPGVINAFAAGAFRFLHTLIPDSIMTCPSSYQSLQRHRLSNNYFNPRLLEQTSESFDDIVRGIVQQNSSESDPFCTTEISNLLFKSSNNWGLDLLAMDIQRGRDHGLASYNEYREICGLRKARCFQDLAGEMSQDRINALQYYYESVDDIDLLIGGAMEVDLEGSIVGQTFQCIIAEQFFRTRVGDRFFYDNYDMDHSFTTEQLKEIKKTSMARLLCDNTDSVYYMQKRAFEVESSYNPKFCCNDYKNIPSVDFTPWKKTLFDIFD